VNPGDNGSFYISFNPISAGSKEAIITLTSNDPSQGSITINVSGNALNLPLLNVSASTQAITLKKQEKKEITILLSNDGAETIHWQLNEVPDWVTISDSAGSLAVDAEDILTATVNGKDLTSQVHSFTLLFTYNHPDNATVTLPITITVAPNNSPKVVSNIEDVEVGVLTDGFLLDLQLNFTDPDNDTLIFSYTADNEAVGTFDLSGSILSFKPLAAGSVNVTVIAEDEANAQTAISFKVNVNAITGVAGDQPLSDIRNNPNPFSATTIFTYYLRKAGNVQLLICDVNGRIVREMVNGFQNEGKKEVVFEDNGSASGFYLYHLVVDGKIAGRGKMLKK
jgi:hypothetical protein